MSADDIYGHVYITKSGTFWPINSNKDSIPPNWVIHYYYRENNDYTFMRRGAERRLCIELNPHINLKYAAEIMNTLKKDSKENKKLHKCLEKMLAHHSRVLDIKD